VSDIGWFFILLIAGKSRNLSYFKLKLELSPEKGTQPPQNAMKRESQEFLF